MGEDEEARRRRAERVHEQIDAERHGESRPRTLRDFTERAAREAAEEERAAEEGERHEDGADGSPAREGG
jgi:hypothetical protein